MPNAWATGLLPNTALILPDLSLSLTPFRFWSYTAFMTSGAVRERLSVSLTNCPNPSQADALTNWCFTEGVVNQHLGDRRHECQRRYAAVRASAGCVRRNLGRMPCIRRCGEGVGKPRSAQKV